RSAYSAWRRRRPPWSFAAPGASSRRPTASRIGCPQQSGSSASVNPSRSSSVQLPQTSAGGGMHSGAAAQSGSAQSTRPSQSLSAPSLHVSAVGVHGVQPERGAWTQTPPEQLSSVQRSPSSQSAVPVHRWQLGTAACVQLPSPPHASVVHGSPSSHWPGPEHGTQPGRDECAQRPNALQLSSVHPSPSSHCATPVQGTQSGRSVCVQVPVACVQPSIVQPLPSSHVGGVPAWQPARPPHVSTPVQASWSSQSALPPSSIRPSQLLSSPSQISGVPVASTWRDAGPLVADVAFSAVAVAVLEASGSLHAAVAVPAMRTVTIAPAGSSGTRIVGGAVPTTVHVTDASLEVTSTVTPDRKAGAAAAAIATPRAAVAPVLCTPIVNATGVGLFADTVVGATPSSTVSVVAGTKGQFR